MIDAKQLASAIVRAEIESNEPITSENEIYWYTREKCLELAVANKIPFSKVISLVEYHDSFELKTNKLKHELLVVITNDIWDQVCHPDIICKYVLNQ